MKVKSIRNDADRLRGLRHVVFSKPFPGAVETFDALRKEGVTMSVFSALHRDLLDRACRDLGIKDYFNLTQSSVDDKVSALRGHLRRAGALSATTLFIGDAADDVIAANANGVVSACVTSGPHGIDRLAKVQPRFVWSAPSDWAPFFRALFHSLSAKSAKPYPVATAGALVVDRKGRVLLVLTPKWGFTYGIPGGKIEKGETAHAAAIRELREETALDVRPGDLFLCLDCVNSPEFHVPDAHFLLLNYIATTRGTKVRLNEEAVSYLWIDPVIALNLRLNSPTRTLIEAYLSAVKPSPFA